MGGVKQVDVESEIMDVEREIIDLKRREDVSEHRIKDLEEDVRDIRQLTKAVAVTAENVKRLQTDVSDVKADVKALAGKPGKLWEKVAAAAVCAVATGMVAALIALIVK